MKNKIDWDNATYAPDFPNYFRVQEENITGEGYFYVIDYTYDDGWLSFSLFLHNFGSSSMSMEVTLCEEKLIKKNIESIAEAKKLVEEHYNNFIKYFVEDN